MFTSFLKRASIDGASFFPRTRAVLVAVVAAFALHGEAACSSHEMEAADGSAAGVASADVFAWGFEPASADCNGWTVLGGDSIRAAPPRSGAYSCKLCADGTADELTMTRDLGAVPPGRYELSAWIRKRAVTAAPDEAALRIEAETMKGTALVAAAAAVPVEERWDRVSTELEIHDEVSAMRVIVGARTTADRCLFVDDVAVVRVP